MPGRLDAMPSADAIAGSAPATVLDLSAHKAEVCRAAETLRKFYGSDALAQAERLEQRLKGSAFAKHVRELLER